MYIRVRYTLVSGISMQCFNNELWMCRWDKETAVEYLKDFFESKRFVIYG